MPHNLDAGKANTRVHVQGLSETSAPSRTAVAVGLEPAITGSSASLCTVTLVAQPTNAPYPEDRPRTVYVDAVRSTRSVNCHGCGHLKVVSSNRQRSFGHRPAE